MKIIELFREERAVSPVIGVILMVAITVILAAVIGTFVMDLGNSVGEGQAPTMSVGFSEDDTDYSNAGDTTYDTFILSHNGGDELSMSDAKVVVRDSSNAAVLTFDSSGWEPTIDDGTNNDSYALLHNGDVVTDSDSFGTGDTLTVEATADAEVDGLAGDEEYTVQVIDTQSGSVVAQGTVRLT